MVLARGFKPRDTALILYGVCGIAAFLSLLQSFASYQFRGLTILVFCSLVFAGINYLGYVEISAARRTLSRKMILRIVKEEIYLQELEHALAEAHTPDECWKVVRNACSDMHFASIQMYLQGESYAGGVQCARNRTELEDEPRYRPRQLSHPHPRCRKQTAEAHDPRPRSPATVNPGQGRYFAEALFPRQATGHLRCRLKHGAGAPCRYLVLQTCSRGSILLRGVPGELTSPTQALAGRRVKGSLVSLGCLAAPVPAPPRCPSCSPPIEPSPTRLCTPSPINGGALRQPPRPYPRVSARAPSP